MARETQYAESTPLLPNARTLTLILVACTCLTEGECIAVGPSVPFTPEPVGSGARALGQSAFIAVADDATAGSWNPAGLINLEKSEVSFVGLWKNVADNRSSNIPNVTWEENTWDVTEINFMSYAQPLKIWNADMVLSVNYHQAYDLTLEYDSFTTNYRGTSDTVKNKEALHGRWMGAISAYSIAGGLSVPCHPKVTLGASFNWYGKSLCNRHAWQGSNIIKISDWYVGSGEPDSVTTTRESLDNLHGYNFTFGLLWDAYEKEQKLLTFGLVCHTPFTARVDWERVKTTQEGNDPPETDPDPDEDRLDFDFPLSLGAGVNYRFHDRLSAAVDVQWTDWSNSEFPGPGSSPSRDALAVRLGFEQLYFSEPSRESVTALRGGVFYEPRPAWSDILSIYGSSLGFGWTVKERFSLDLAYQFRWGDEDLGEFDDHIEEHWLIASVIWYR